MAKYYVEVHSEAIKEFDDIEADTDEEAKEYALENTDLEDPVIFSMFRIEE